MTTGPTTTSTGQIVKTQDSADSIRALLQRPDVQKAISESLPKNAGGLERFNRVALTSLRKNAELQRCSPGSFVSALLQCATLGLEPDNGLGHAYLVPYGKECTLILGYRGLADLARRSGQVSTISTHVVRSGDLFEYELGLHPKLVHKPVAAPSYPPGKNVTHAYAVVTLRDGGTQFDVMTKDEIDAIRRRSKAGTNGPWVTDYEEMAKKTVLRRLAKLLPMSIEAQKAAMIDEQAETGQVQTFDVDFNVLADDGPRATAPVSHAVDAGDPEEMLCPLHNTYFQPPRKEGWAPTHPMDGGGNCNPGIALAGLAERVGWDRDRLNAYLRDVYNVTASKVSLAQMHETAGFLKGMAGATAAAAAAEEEEAGQPAMFADAQ